VSAFDALRNAGFKVARRIQAAPKPLVRAMRRHSRAQEHRAFRREAEAIDREIAALAATTGPIVVGPWLAEVGYEVLYWIPFLRWFHDAFGVSSDRLIVVSRGGMESLYRDVAAAYVDIFDLTTPQQMAARNAQRRSEGEGGGQKQSAASAFDHELIEAVRSMRGLGEVAICHPSLMFRLFRNVWHGNLPFDLLWRRTRHVAHDGRSNRPSLAELRRSAVALAEAERTGPTMRALPPVIPDDFIAAKIYAGPALSTHEKTRQAVRGMVAQAATIAPVVLLEGDLGIDEHRDFDLDGIPNVISARSLMSPRTNLDVQLALIARARFFLSACGGLAWQAPFMGVPTVAIYDSDSLLAPHLFVTRHATALTGAAEFTPLDLRGVTRIGLSQPAPSQRSESSGTT
jgi:hypothetical protein